MICVSIQTKGIDACLAALEGVEMAEIRLDLTEIGEKDVERLFSTAKIPLIATCRYDAIDDPQRISLLSSAIKSGAAFVDIEIESDSTFKDTIKSIAKANNCRVIISYHNYKETPQRETLNLLVDQCIREGADIAKIATTANSVNDSARILGLYDKYPSVVALAMGNLGKITRVAAIKLGAPFTFAAKDASQATAPGQLTQKEFESIYSII